VKKSTKKAAKPTPAKTQSTVKKGAASKKKAAPARAGKAVAKKSAGSAKAASTRTSTKTAKGTAKKPTRSAAARKGRRDIDDRIDMKTGSIAGKPGSFGFSSGGSGGGISFLGGKPGSSGSTDEGTGEVKKLTRTKLNVRELRNFRDLLLQKRRQLMGDMDSMESEALRTEGTNLSHLPVHMADMGTDNYEQEFTLNLVDRDRKLIDEIDHALAKIDNKTYGICEGTGQMITKARLEAQPWARFSIEHARRLQQPGMRR
jgi:RNA polymerase-binding protein DksA